MTCEELGISWIDTPDKCPEEKCYIYVLLDPDNLNIRYVGKTIQKLSLRLYEHNQTTSPWSRARHYCRNWIKSLQDLNKKPLIKVIDIVSIQSWEDYEKYYIKYFRECGVKLTNISDGGKGCSSNIHRKWSEEKRKIIRNNIRLRNKNLFLILPNGDIVLDKVNFHDIEEFTGIKRRYLYNSYAKQCMVLQKYFIVSEVMPISTNKKMCLYKIQNMDTNEILILKSFKELYTFLKIPYSTLGRKLEKNNIINRYKIEKYYGELY